MAYYVYIMSSNSGTLYTGMTNNIDRRVRQHKSGDFEGFASKYRCTRLVFYEEYGQVLSAIGREKEIKGWKRCKKIALIESMNPRWQDLAEHWGRQMIFPNQPLTSSGNQKNT